MGFSSAGHIVHVIDKKITVFTRKGERDFSCNQRYVAGAGMSGAKRKIIHANAGGQSVADANIA